MHRGESGFGVGLQKRPECPIGSFEQEEDSGSLEESGFCGT